MRELRRGRGKCCSLSCKSSLIGRGRTGAKNNGWKGGVAADNYHYKKLQKERYPDRVNARAAVAHAVKAGKLVRQPCTCGATEVQGHHHLGYARENWLNVLWRCRDCHRADHGGMKFAAKPAREVIV